jgi:alkylated DNA repair protein alkB homolog 1
MGGHRDELELALDKPIVSISLGRSAVFVLGGKTLQDGPIIPMIVRSGDVIVLGGDARLNYHSMARLLPRTFPTTPPMMMMEQDPSLLLITSAQVGMVRERPLAPHDVDLVDRYLASHRININIRQVYNNSSQQ